MLTSHEAQIGKEKRWRERERATWFFNATRVRPNQLAQYGTQQNSSIYPSTTTRKERCMEEFPRTTNHFVKYTNQPVPNASICTWWKRRRCKCWAQGEPSLSSTKREEGRTTKRRKVGGLNIYNVQAVRAAKNEKLPIKVPHLHAPLSIAQHNFFSLHPSSTPSMPFVIDSLCCHFVPLRRYSFIISLALLWKMPRDLEVSNLLAHRLGCFGASFQVAWGLTRFDRLLVQELKNHVAQPPVCFCRKCDILGKLNETFSVLALTQRHASFSLIFATQTQCITLYWLSPMKGKSWLFSSFKSGNSSGSKTSVWPTRQTLRNGSATSSNASNKPRSLSSS